MLSPAIVALAIATVTVRAGPVDSLYPNITDPESLKNPSYNAIPSGHLYESRTSAGDGSYLYCSMPHPQTSYYKEPKPVQNGTVSANLTGLLYVQRHQKRTAYHIFPNGEATKYNCDNGKPYLYFAPNGVDAPEPVPVYAQTYADSQNPLLRTFTNSSCQFPQLTIGGYKDGVQHGEELRKLYGDKYHVIPNEPSSDSVYLRSSTAALTQQSASGVLRGLWPKLNKPVVLEQQSDSVDTHEPSCDRVDTLESAAQKASPWIKHMNATQDLRKKLESVLLTNTSEWRSDWDHYNDNFQARLCNGYDLPCALDNDKNCVSREEANKVFAAGDWEYNYYWVERENVTEAIQLTSGLFISDLISKVKDIASDNSELKYAHFFMHDGDLGPLAGSLGIKTLRWPGMASNIAVELWKTSKGEDYVRVLYSGSTIRSKHADMEWLPLQDFLRIWGKYVPSNFVEQCAA